VRVHVRARADDGEQAHLGDHRVIIIIIRIYYVIGIVLFISCFLI